MNFFAKIKNLFSAHKSSFSLGLLAAVLLLGLIFQYASYYAFDAAENAAHAEKSGQRVVVDLQDKKWFSTGLVESEIIMQDEIKFSADGKDMPDDIAIDVDLKDVTPQAKPKEDDALTLAEKEALLKKKAEENKAKPDVKPLNDDKISALKSKGTVSIIITNLGLSDANIKLAARLSKEFTMSFTPYGQLTTKSSIQLAEEGFTILAELPMESVAKREDGGKFSLTAVNDDKKNAKNFEAVLSIIPSASGFVSPVDDDLSSEKKFDSIMKIITDKKSSLIYQGKSPKRVREYAAIYGLDAQIPDLTIDNQASAESIEAQLRALETIALEKGSALGIAHPYPITFEVLEKWQATLPAKNLTLVSAVEK